MKLNLLFGAILNLFICATGFAFQAADANGDGKINSHSAKSDFEAFERTSPPKETCSETTRKKIIEDNLLRECEDISREAAGFTCYLRGYTGTTPVMCKYIFSISTPHHYNGAMLYSQSESLSCVAQDGRRPSINLVDGIPPHLVGYSMDKQNSTAYSEVSGTTLPAAGCRLQ